MGNKCTLKEVCSMPTHPAKFLDEHQEQFETPNGPGLKPHINGRFLPEALADRIIALLNEAVKPENCEAELFSCGLLNEARAILAEMTEEK